MAVSVSARSASSRRSDWPDSPTPIDSHRRRSVQGAVPFSPDDRSRTRRAPSSNCRSPRRRIPPRRSAWSSCCARTRSDRAPTSAIFRRSSAAAAFRRALDACPRLKLNVVIGRRSKGDGRGLSVPARCGMRTVRMREECVLCGAAFVAVVQATEVRNCHDVAIVT